MEDKENKPRQLSCLTRGPGPAYLLPTLVGYVGHDPSRYRNPAYSMNFRTHTNIYSVGPGPCYKIDQQTKFGIEKSPAFTMGHREMSKLQNTGPGPGSYNPEHCPPMNHSIRPAAYSIQSRYGGKLTDSGPGPNAYLVPTCIGPKIPDKKAEGAFTISGPHPGSRYESSPGPAAYRNVNCDLVKKKMPAYTVSSRVGPREAFRDGPGPQYYPQVYKGKKPPMYSFGVRHSECATTPVTEYDE
ncbi:outer dense fiber protein 3-like [Cephus cinctus]|uniref:Outer dense fiber protein 3-like n=1 Tax=Cephus cinctus TaxID=211228 RepID=A0AAJ7C6W4_CEPCN|nr:outer dense fiber protein 3-like [Cephus cinctus]